jgi:hypothetical protein
MANLPTPEESARAILAIFAFHNSRCLPTSRWEGSRISGWPRIRSSKRLAGDRRKQYHQAYECRFYRNVKSDKIQTESPGE